MKLLSSKLGIVESPRPPSVAHNSFGEALLNRTGLCDDYLPSVNQMVALFQDPQRSGRAIPENIAVFYTNLGDPTDPTGGSFARAVGGIYKYFLDQRLGTAWYSSMTNSDMTFIRAQQAFLDKNIADFVARYGKPGDDVKVLFGGCFSQALAYAAR